MRAETTGSSRLAKAAAALSAALLIAVLPGTAASADTTFTFRGGGFGHSVGLSQYGAYGMALDGYSWQEIITHYFSDTTVTEAAPVIVDPPLWIGLVQEQSSVEFKVIATGSQSASPVTITRGAKTLTASEGDVVRIEHLGDNRCRVTTPTESITGSCAVDLEWDGWAAQPTTALQLGGCTFLNWNSPGGSTYQPCTYARGTMHVRPDNNTQRVDVSVEIDIEDYVLGISESPYGWGRNGGMAALQAQAVAARSYALHRALDRGDPADRNWCWCHIYDTSIDQVYVGWGHATQEWIDAVRTTAHMVPTHSSETYQGAPMPIEAFYSSSTFGWTEHSEHGFTAYVPYLRGVDDHWSLMPEVNNGNGRWTREFTGSELAAELPGVSSVTGLAITKCSPSGAALEITFDGSHGSKTFTTRELRGMLGLRSMQVYSAGSPAPSAPACPQPDAGSGDPDPSPQSGGPVTLVGLTLDDDNADDSQGNGNALAECGEIVEAYTTIRNQGGALSGVGATLTSDDPYVTVRWNSTSTFPGLSPDGEAANQDDWDLTVAGDTPDGHQAHLTLRVDASEGGPWNLEVTVPVACDTGGDMAAVTIGDTSGNGAAEIVTAYRAPSGRPFVAARDSATGLRIARVALAPSGFAVIDLETIPNDPHSVAVLVRRATDGRTKVVVVDIADGAKKADIQYGKRDVAALSVLPDVEGRPGYAVAERKANGRTRVIVRDVDGTKMSKVGLAVEALDMVRLDNLGAGAAKDLAVLGRRGNGKVVAIAFDPGTGDRLKVVSPRLQGDPVDLEVLRSGPNRRLRSLVVLAPSSDGSEAVVVDALTGKRRARVEVPITTPIDLEVLRALDGVDGEAVAVLGIAPDGASSAIVIDPGPARLIAGPVFAPDASPVDLTVISGMGPSGTALASLGVYAAGDAVLSIRDAGSGASLGELPVP